jgi:hypothetical protein
MNMEIDWSTIAWIAGLTFVYIFGLVEGRIKGYRKRKAEEEQEKQAQPPPPPETVTVTVDDPGILRVKHENGALALDLDGNRVNPNSLSLGQRQRLIEVLSILRPWVEGKAGSPPPTTASGPSFQPQHTSSLSAQPVPAQSPSPPPATRTTGVQKPVVIPVEDRPAAPANSIVTQIDTILQSRLAGTPLEERGIFLTQSPEGGVIVYVGLTRYHGVEEVPDAEIKAAIRDAIIEWENKYTPGL